MTASRHAAMFWELVIPGRSPLPVRTKPLADILKRKYESLLGVQCVVRERQPASRRIGPKLKIVS